MSPKPLNPLQHRALVALWAGLALVPLTSLAADTSAAQQLERWSAQAGAPGQPERGRAFFTTPHGGEWSCGFVPRQSADGEGQAREHRQGDRPARTGLQPGTFTDSAKVDKWFRRNCIDVWAVSAAPARRPTCWPTCRALRAEPHARALASKAEHETNALPEPSSLPRRSAWPEPRRRLTAQQPGHAARHACCVQHGGARVLSHRLTRRRCCPARRWQRIMSSLDRHYGTDASLNAATLRQIPGSSRTPATTQRVREEPREDRITRSAWFEREHREYPHASVWRLESVKSAANCAACHPGAERGEVSRPKSTRAQGPGRPRACLRRAWND